MRMRIPGQQPHNASSSGSGRRRRKGGRGMSGWLAGGLRLFLSYHSFV